MPRDAENPLNTNNSNLVNSIQKFFDYDFRNLTCPTVNADDQHKICNYTFDMLDKPYQTQLLNLREEIADISKQNQLSNLPDNFMAIGEKADEIFGNSHVNNI